MTWLNHSGIRAAFYESFGLGVVPSEEEPGWRGEQVIVKDYFPPNLPSSPLRPYPFFPTDFSSFLNRRISRTFGQKVILLVSNHFLLDHF